MALFLPLPASVRAAHGPRPQPQPVAQAIVYADIPHDTRTLLPHDWPLSWPVDVSCVRCQGTGAHPWHLPLEIRSTWVILSSLTFCSLACARAFNEAHTQGLHRKTEINQALYVLKSRLDRLELLHNVTSQLEVSLQSQNGRDQSQGKMPHESEILCGDMDPL